MWLTVDLNQGTLNLFGPEKGVGNHSSFPEAIYLLSEINLLPPSASGPAPWGAMPPLSEILLEIAPSLQVTIELERVIVVSRAETLEGANMGKCFMRAKFLVSAKLRHVQGADLALTGSQQSLRPK